MRKGLPAGAKPAKPRGAKGRRAAKPDAARALGDLTAFLRRAMGGLRGRIGEAFGAIPGRHEERCTYSPATLCMALLGVFLLREGSVCSADADRNCGSYARWLRAVLGMPPDAGAGAPCGELLRHWFNRADPRLVGALLRLAPRLKAAFPRLAICLVGDALYACERVFALCGENGWHFIATFKRGRLPAVSRETDALLELSPGNRSPYMPEGWAARRRIRDGAPVETDGEVAWVQKVDFTQPKGPGRLLTVVECR